MINKIIRLQSIEIINLKNIKYGKLDLPSYMKKIYYEDKAEIMGIYGQNGSGKTSVIDVLQIMKTLISGQKLQSDICNYIYSLSNATTFKFNFFIESDFKYLVNYDISFKMLDDSAEIISEKLSYIKLNTRSKVTIVSYNEKIDSFPIVPEARYKELIKQNKENKIDIQVLKKICKKENISFIFHEDLINMFKNKDNIEYYEIMKTLQNYSKFNLFVIKNKNSTPINFNIMPIEHNLVQDDIVEGLYISVNLLGKSNVTEYEYNILIKVINQINIVLSKIIPNLKVEFINLGNGFNNRGEEFMEVELFSNRDNIKIPLRYESEGIIKIISILSTLISVFNNPSVCLVVDDLDSGIYEYLLGELLEILEKYGKGQFVFTSHNLRGLEKLSKTCIVISTSNSKNRFIRFPNIKSRKNLRNEYLRIADLGGLNEQVYEGNNLFEISHAFRKAGRSYESN